VDFDQVETKKFEFKSFKNKMVQWRILQKTPTTALNNFELNSSDENNSLILNDYEFCGNKCALLQIVILEYQKCYQQPRLTQS